MERTLEFSGTGDCVLLGIFRRGPSGSAVRFRCRLSSTKPAKLTQVSGKPNLLLLGADLSSLPNRVEVRLSEFSDLLHSYTLQEVPIHSAQFTDAEQIVGPIITAWNDLGRGVVLGYEHGSTYPDAFNAFQLAATGSVSLVATRGNYLRDVPVGQGDHAFETLWMQMMTTTGGIGGAASTYRKFMLEGQPTNASSRAPLIFYNTWCHQERNKYWRKHGSYHDDMHETHILREIEACAQIGVEVFVIDTGYFTATGDWTIDTRRFPRGLAPVRSAIEQHGMRLGLWFDNAAAVGGPMHTEHLDCLQTRDGKPGKPHSIWETAPAQRVCMVSRYWQAFADTLIRMHHETGVTYFKLDAIDQYGCDDPCHDHGDASHSCTERSDMHAFLLPLYLLKVVERVQEKVPEAIVDFDVTERGRAFGTAFMAAGKYFLINNGPYCHNYDIPDGQWPDGNPNLFFRPGRARTWICRSTLAIDRWIPSNLLLAHYYPDGPLPQQELAVASLVLGHHGIWGDPLEVSDESRRYMRDLLDCYKQVRQDAVKADPVTTGIVSGSLEVHEKINPANARGVVCFFNASSGTFNYVTRNQVSPAFHASGPVNLEICPDGRARIRIEFAKTDHARVVCFGISEAPIRQNRMPCPG